MRTHMVVVRVLPRWIYFINSPHTAFLTRQVRCAFQPWKVTNAVKPDSTTISNALVHLLRYAVDNLGRGFLGEIGKRQSDLGHG